MTQSQPASPPKVGVLMGSVSDGATVQHGLELLRELGVSHEVRVMSAHRTPEDVAAYARSAADRGLKVLVCAAGGAAHLAGVVSAHTLLPVLGIPIQAWATDGLDSLLSTVQMPGGVPVGTLAIGKPGAQNAALLAVAILALSDPDLARRYADYRRAQAERVRSQSFPEG